MRMDDPVGLRREKISCRPTQWVSKLRERLKPPEVEKLIKN
jgi:hypothetical protein